jgi:hypothetical protein
MFTSNNSETLNSATSINVVTDAARGLPWVDYVTRSLSACRTFFYLGKERNAGRLQQKVCSCDCFPLFSSLFLSTSSFTLAVTLPLYAKGLSGISLYAEEKIAEAANKVLHPYLTLPLFYSLILLLISCSQQGCTLFIVNGVRKFEYDKPNIFRGSRERDARASIHLYLLR